MIAKLIIHPILETRVGEAEQILASFDLKKNHPDLLWIEEEKLGVEQAKKIREHLSLKPFSAQGRGVVVENAQNLTVDAQNSLLKTLEEPPTEAIILLLSDSDKKILPTVLSRVEIIRGKGEAKRGKESNSSPFFVDIEKLLNSPIEQRFEFVEKLEDKEEFLDALLTYYQNQLTTNYQLPTTNFVKALMVAEQWKQANGNMRAILEYLMLTMP